MDGLIQVNSRTEYISISIITFQHITLYPRYDCQLKSGKAILSSSTHMCLMCPIDVKISYTILTLPEKNTLCNKDSGVWDI